jgi:O-antigen/teichoic acid export membrane protein
LIEFAVYPLLMLLATPFFIKKLGVEQLGIWMLINSIIGSLGVLSGGFGDAAIKFISKYRAHNDESGIKRVVNATYSLFFFISILVVIFGYLVLFTEDKFAFFTNNTSNRELIFKSLYVVILLFAGRLIEQIILAIFRGFERYDIASKFSIISKTSMLLVNILLAGLGFSLIQIFISSTLITFVNLVFEIVWIRKFYRHIEFVPKYDKETIREVSSFSVWSWLQTLSGIMFSQLDKFLVAYCAGLKVLAYYSIGFMVANQIHAMFSAMSSWLFPVISKKVEQKTDIIEPYLRIQFFLISSALFMITVLYVFRQFIFTKWLGTETYAESITFIEGFLYLEVFLIPFIVPFYYYNAAGLIKQNTIFMVASNLAMLIFIYVCFRLQGHDGLIWGRLVGFFIVFAIWLYDIHTRLLKDYGLMKGIVAFMPSIIFILFFTIHNFYIQIPLAAIFIFFLWRLYRAALVEKM